VAHNEVVAIDSTEHSDREALYSILDSLLSGRPLAADRNNPDKVTIVRVRWHVDASVHEHSGSMRATLDRAIAAATNSTGHVVRLGASELLIVAAQQHLLASGLGPSPQQRTARATDIEVVEIANSLQLREVLGLTVVSETQVPSGKPLIH
jgi:hypothetical protein